MATWVTASRQACGCAVSHAVTAAAERPSTWPSSPPCPAASTKPVCHRSQTSTHRPVAGSRAHRGRPRRVSSMPSTATGGSGSASTGSTRSANAACTVAQDTR